ADLAIGALEHFLAEAVDALPLMIHHLVVFEEVLADVEVALLDLFLGRLDAAAHHAALDRLPFFHAQALPDAGHPLAGEDAHQVVLERDVEPARTRIALPAGAAAKLVVDAPRLVPLGAHDMQAAHVGDLAPFFLHLLLRADLVDRLLPDVGRHVEPRR